MSRAVPIELLQDARLGHAAVRVACALWWLASEVDGRLVCLASTADVARAAGVSPDVVASQVRRGRARAGSLAMAEWVERVEQLGGWLLDPRGVAMTPGSPRPPGHEHRGGGRHDPGTRRPSPRVTMTPTPGHHDPVERRGEGGYGGVRGVSGPAQGGGDAPEPPPCREGGGEAPLTLTPPDEPKPRRAKKPRGGSPHWPPSPEAEATLRRVLGALSDAREAAGWAGLRLRHASPLDRKRHGYLARRLHELGAEGYDDPAAVLVAVYQAQVDKCRRDGGDAQRWANAVTPLRDVLWDACLAAGLEWLRGKRPQARPNTKRGGALGVVGSGSNSTSAKSALATTDPGSAQAAVDLEDEPLTLQHPDPPSARSRGDRRAKRTAFDPTDIERTTMGRINDELLRLRAAAGWPRRSLTVCETHCTGLLACLRQGLAEAAALDIVRATLWVHSTSGDKASNGQHAELTTMFGERKRGEERRLRSEKYVERWIHAGRPPPRRRGGEPGTFTQRGRVAYRQVGSDPPPEQYEREVEEAFRRAGQG